jgi:hypothetical protein
MFAYLIESLKKHHAFILLLHNCFFFSFQKISYDSIVKGKERKKKYKYIGACANNKACQNIFTSISEWIL